MKKVGIVSCDEWINKLEEDRNLIISLNNLGLDAKMISWQQPLNEEFDILVLRSVWGYQKNYKEFKEWLLDIKNKNIPLVNNVDIVLDNIRKDIQFSILEKNKISFINTIFLSKLDFSFERVSEIIKDGTYVIKPTISGSGDNTFLIDNGKLNVPNMIQKENILEKYKLLLENDECKIMLQPYIKEINNGEYSCIFIDGKLTHTMLRFPNIFHDKKKPFLVTDIPNVIIECAKKVERIPEFNNYLYMRVDMVLVDGKAQIMEVELADPDLLTKYISDDHIKNNAIGEFAKKIEGRIK